MQRAKEQLQICRQRGIRKIAAGNVGLLLQAKEMGFSLIGTADLNVGNAASAAFWKKFGLEMVEASRELNLRGIEALTGRSSLPVEVTGYGKTALMKIENCLIQVAKDGCGCAAGKQYVLQDRKGAQMRVARDGCISTVYNSVPVYMADRMQALRRSGRQRGETGVYRGSAAAMFGDLSGICIRRRRAAAALHARSFLSGCRIV